MFKKFERKLYSHIADIKNNLYDIHHEINWTNFPSNKKQYNLLNFIHGKILYSLGNMNRIQKTLLKSNMELYSVLLNKIPKKANSIQETESTLDHYISCPSLRLQGKCRHPAE